MYRASGFGQFGASSNFSSVPSLFVPDPSFMQPPPPASGAWPVTEAGGRAAPAPVKAPRSKPAAAAVPKAAKQPAKQRKNTNTGKVGGTNPGRSIGLQQLRKRAQQAAAPAGQVLPTAAARQDPPTKPDQDDGVDYDGLSGDSRSWQAWIRRSFVVHSQLVSRQAVNFDTLTNQERGELCRMTHEFKLHLNNKVDASHRIIIKDGVYKAIASWFTLTYLADTEFRLTEEQVGNMLMNVLS